MKTKVWESDSESSLEQSEVEEEKEKEKGKEKEKEREREKESKVVSSKVLKSTLKASAAFCCIRNNSSIKSI